MSLPVAADWFRARLLSPGLTLIDEPHMHPLFQANMYLVEGAERDMILDTGMGVAPLRPYLEALRGDRGKPLICVSSHAHLDHIGGAHEFDDRRIHAAEAADQANPEPYSLLKSGYAPESLARYAAAGYPPLWDVVIDALPSSGYDPTAYALRGAPATSFVAEGDVIDLGGRLWKVWHLPGHSPGGIGMFERSSGVLISSDAIYDGPLIYDGPGTDLDAYEASFRKLEALPVSIVHGGHNSAFGPERMAEIIAHYRALWASLDAPSR